jgi:DNA-binding CsgD family transcriptional regulator
VAVADRLVGRTTELDSVERLLEELAEGSGAALEVVGEPGIGKTRLLAELAGRADECGYLVLFGSASELESDLPFSVFVDALDDYVQSLEPERLASLDDGTRAELAQVLPSLPAITTSHGGPLGHERYRAHRAVRTMLEVLATTRPVVLVLDDLHWADPGSVELVGALLHRQPAAAVLMAVAMRPRQVPDRLSAGLERAHRAGTLTRVELGALTLDEVQELVRDRDGDTNASVLYEESGGNPFYVQELTRSLARASGARFRSDVLDLGGVEVPSMVAAALLEELSLLTDGARALLEGAAVAGDPFEPELAAAGAGTSEQSAIAALDELLARDLVRPTEVPRRFRFRHPLVRRAVYEATPAGWRLGAHERCAEVLATRGAPAAARAHHVERSARQGDLDAIATLRESGDAAAHRTPASAARWYAAALRLLPETAPVEDRVELLRARGAALAATGQFAESQDALLESIRIAPRDAAALRVRLVVTCARLEHLVGRHRDARARLERALEELPNPTSPEAVGLMIELAVDEIYRTVPEEGREWGIRAIEAARSIGDPVLLAAALAVRAATAALSGAAREAAEPREEAAQLVARLSDDQLAGQVDALAHLAIAEYYTDGFKAAGRYAARAVAISRATGQEDVFPAVHTLLGGSLCLQGRVAEGTKVLDDAVESARLSGNAHALAWALVNRASVAWAIGDLELAAALSEECGEVAKELDDGLVTVSRAVTYAPTLYELGDPAGAAELLLRFVGDDELRLGKSGWGSRSLELLTRCLLDTGRRAEAEPIVAAMTARADEIGSATANAMARRAEAALALHDGRCVEAAELALTAAELLDGIDDRYDGARARAYAGRALALGGENDRAAAELERAAAAFESFGATRYRDEAVQELRKLGRTVYRRSAKSAGDGGLSELTARELELARLVVERKTNPQIAAELFLSQKTVETHLRNIFRKVGVANRVELARAVEQADRAEEPTKA